MPRLICKYPAVGGTINLTYYTQMQELTEEELEQVTGGVAHAYLQYFSPVISEMGDIAN